MRVLRNLFLFIVVPVAVLVLVVATMGESLVSEGIETVGPDMTGTSVEVGGVSVGLLRGSAGIDDLIIGNPAGFDEPFAFKLRSVQTELDSMSLFSDEVLIHRIEIVNPEIMIEQKDIGQNLRKIAENIEAYVGPMAEEDESAPPTTLVIEDLYIRQARIVISGMAMETLNQDITLPDIHLQGIGQKDNGVLAADAAKQVFAALMKEVQTALVKAQAEGLIKDKINVLGGGDSGGGIGSKIKGWFGRD